MSKVEYKWPYQNEMDQEETIDSDVLVLGGGLSGCFAAIAAARKGQSVTLVEAEPPEPVLTIGNRPAPIPAPVSLRRRSPGLMSGSRTGTAMGSPIISSAGKDMTGFWIWRHSAGRSGIRKMNLQGPGSGMRRAS